MFKFLSKLLFWRKPQVEEQPKSKRPVKARKRKATGPSQAKYTRQMKKALRMQDVHGRAALLANLYQGLSPEQLEEVRRIAGNLRRNKRAKFERSKLPGHIESWFYNTFLNNRHMAMQDGSSYIYRARVKNAEAPAHKEKLKIRASALAHATTPTEMAAA